MSLDESMIELKTYRRVDNSSEYIAEDAKLEKVAKLNTCISSDQK